MGARNLITREVGQRVAKQLAQSRPANTAAVSLYSPADGVHTTVKKVFVCNVTAADAIYDLYHDDDGTTYDETTALYFGRTVTANMTHELELNIDMANPDGNLAVRSDVTSAVNFSAYGEEIQTRAR